MIDLSRSSMMYARPKAEMARGESNLIKIALNSIVCEPGGRVPIDGFERGKTKKWTGASQEHICINKEAQEPNARTAGSEGLIRGWGTSSPLIKSFAGVLPPISSGDSVGPSKWIAGVLPPTSTPSIPVFESEDGTETQVIVFTQIPRFLMGNAYMHMQSSVNLHLS